MEKLSIGGIANANSTHITHVIRLKTPFTNRGTPLQIAFGLANQVTCTAILGTPFFKAVYCSLNYANNTFYVQSFDRALEMVYAKPGLREIPDKDTPLDLLQ